VTSPFDPSLIDRLSRFFTTADSLSIL